MSDISKIKIGDETYGIKDARIVSGTLEGNKEVAFTGAMIVFHVYIPSGTTNCVTAICADGTMGYNPSEPTWMGIVYDGDSNYRLTNEFNTTIYYTAIITDE